MSTVSSSSGSTGSGVAQRASTWQDRLQGPQALCLFLYTHMEQRELLPDSLGFLNSNIQTLFLHVLLTHSFWRLDTDEDSLLTVVV